MGRNGLLAHYGNLIGQLSDAISSSLLHDLHERLNVDFWIW